jgi:hypothetical protein
MQAIERRDRPSDYGSLGSCRTALVDADLWTAREARYRGPPDLSVYSLGAIAARIWALVRWMNSSEEISVSLSPE